MEKRRLRRAGRQSRTNTCRRCKAESIGERVRSISLASFNNMTAVPGTNRSYLRLGDQRPLSTTRSRGPAVLAVLGVIASSLLCAAPASAIGDTGSDNSLGGAAGQSQTTGAHSSSPDARRGETDDKQAADDPGPSSKFATGHDKCKRIKGNRRLLPWCVDPAAGWMGDTTYVVQAHVTGPEGICDGSSLIPPNHCRHYDDYRP
jgi:hypothetical protein